MLHVAETIDTQQKNIKGDYLSFTKCFKSYWSTISKSKLRKKLIEDKLHYIEQVKRVNTLVQHLYSSLTLSFKEFKPKKISTVFLQYYLFFRYVNERIKTLEDTFRKQWYIHTDFHIRSSIRKLLFVFVSQFAYNFIAASNIKIATLKLYQMTNEKMRKLNLNKIQQKFINYWILDKLVLVNVLSKIKKI